MQNEVSVLRRYLARGRGFLGEVVYGTGVLAFAQFLISVLAFIVQVYAAKKLGQSAFGEYRYGVALLGVFSLATLAGMSTALAKSVAQGFEGSLVTTVMARIRYGLLGTVAALLLGGYYLFSGDRSLSFMCFIIACGVPFVDSLLVAESFVLGKSRFALAGIFQVLVQMAAVILISTGLLLGFGPVSLFGLYVASLIAARAVIFQYTKKLVSNHLVDPGTITYGKRLSWFPMLGVVSGYADKLLVFNALGPAELGVYSLALAPINQIVAALKNINVVLFPRMARAAQKGKEQMGTKKFALFLLVLCLATVGYWLCAPILFIWILPEYASALPFTRLLSLAVPPLVLVRYYQNTYFVSEQLRPHNLYNTASPLIQVICLYLGLHFYGIIGVVYGYVISKYVSLVLAYLLEAYGKKPNP